MMVPVDLIRADQQAQPRVVMSNQTIEEYQADMAEGATFPPLVVFHDGAVYWLADGFHRLFAARGLGVAEMDCDVRPGGLRDAILFSCSANASHGQRRTNEDKIRAVERLLNDPEWSAWSDREIARRCAVVPVTVAGCRSRLSVHDGQIQTRTVQRGGKIYEMNVANIGQKEPAPVARQRSVVISPEPETHAWIAIALEDLAAAYDKLPDANDAIMRIPRNMRRSIHPEKLRNLADWLGAFASEWEKSLEAAR